MSERELQYLTSPEAAREQERKERSRYLVELFANGLDEKNSIGYHGTSIEVIRYIIENGHMPGASEDILTPNAPHVMPKGNLYFFPRKELFLEHPLADTFKSEDIIIEEASSYAENIAFKHYFATKLGLPLNDTEATNNALSILVDGYVDPKGDARYFIEKGFTVEQLEKLAKEARNRKGVLLSLDSRLLKGYTLVNGDQDEGDLAIQCPEGLDYRSINGIEPLGQYEYEWFEALQKSV